MQLSPTVLKELRLISKYFRELISRKVPGVILVIVLRLISKVSNALTTCMLE